MVDADECVKHALSKVEVPSAYLFRRFIVFAYMKFSSRGMTAEVIASTVHNRPPSCLPRRKGLVSAVCACASAYY